MYSKILNMINVIILWTINLTKYTLNIVLKLRYIDNNNLSNDTCSNHNLIFICLMKVI